MIETGMTGRVAIVTGANSPLGIGAAIARALAAADVRIGLAVLPKAGGVTWDGLPPGGELYAAVGDADGTQVRDEIRTTGRDAVLFPVDLADPAECPALFDRVERELGPVDILVNNAAYGSPDSFSPGEGTSFYRDSQPLTAGTLDAHYAVNVRAPALLMAELHRRHITRGTRWGRVVNLSTDGAAAFPTEVSYGATKNALESLSRSAAHELGPAGITVNIVAPGPIQTGWITEEMSPEICRDTPLGRVGAPSDVADVVTFLASEQARWLTGQTLYVGGGHRMV